MTSFLPQRLIVSLVFIGVVLRPFAEARAGGVTVITHGFSGNVTDWIIPMCNGIAGYPNARGTNFSLYRISITRPGGSYVTTPTFLGGANPSSSDSGEIVIALDWSSLSGLFPAVSTAAIAQQAANALTTNNLTPALGGRALAELPLHLAGHSRGASVMAELAKVLGAQGIWVDHLTTMDPFPVAGFGDPAVMNYANVLFTDNYWQQTDDPKGQSLSGAFNRFLPNLAVGGYLSGSAHSDVHLWYHGTIEMTTPLTVDGATISATERTNWWTAAEAGGANAGFFYSWLGEGDRLSTLEPAEPGTDAVVDGFNQYWNLGAGISANRTALPANNGVWPNVIRLNVLETNWFIAGEQIPLALYCQLGTNSSAVGNLRIQLDLDFNPWNSNEIQIAEANLAGTGPTNVAYHPVLVLPDPMTTLPGVYAVSARLSLGGRTRYAWAPEKIVLLPGTQPPSLVNARLEDNAFRFTVSGMPGQKVELQVSTDLEHWTGVSTNTLATGQLEVEDPDFARVTRRLFRARLIPQ